MTESALTSLFDRSPTRELEEVQKVNEISQAERDIDEFYETESAREVLTELGKIVNTRGSQPRFRYVHATFGSGKTHLLKLIGFATGEISGLESLAPKLSSRFSGFKEFREQLDSSHIDHLIPLFMNLLDRDKVRGSTLSLLIYEELGNQLNYPTDPLWLLEWVWRLEIEHGLWDAVSSIEHDGMTLQEAANDKATLRPWLYEALPEIPETTNTPYDSEVGVRQTISDAVEQIGTGEFTPNELAERLDRTKRYLQTTGETYEFLIGLDEVAIYVGDQQHRYRELFDTVETLIAEINPPILATGQWSLRDMQQDFMGEVDPDEWYTNEVLLRGADTEVIVRKRWLRKSDSGADTVHTLLAEAPDIEPELGEIADYAGLGDPIESYPFREHDLWLLREVLQSLKKDDLEVDREYVQGRALLILVRSLFTGGQWAENSAATPWAERSPGQIVTWDEIYDLLDWDTMDIPGWAKNQIKRVENTSDEMGLRVAKVLYLLGQVDAVPSTKENVTRLLIDSIETDVNELERSVENALQALMDDNFVRADESTQPRTYKILSKEIVEFWDRVRQEAAAIPKHQLRYRIEDLIRESDRGRLTAHDSLRTRNFDEVSDVPYTVRYTVLDQIETSPEQRYDGVVVRVLAADSGTQVDAQMAWREVNSDQQGVEDILISLELSEGLRERIRHLIAMGSVLKKDADPRPELRIEQQQEEETVEDEIQNLLYNAELYTPDHSTARGTYLDGIDQVMSEAVKEKFENRKVLETRLQEVDDARNLFEFFIGTGTWPFTSDDAEMLGVKTVPREIGGGWAEEFLNDFAGEELVSGETVLDQIEGRRGKYLGTPREALAALLLTLAAANKIEVRRDGVRIEDPGEIGRVMIQISDIRDIDIGFDPVDIEGSADLKSVYRSLRGFAPQGNDPTAWLSNLADWAEENSSNIRNTCARVSLEFDEEISLDELEEALEPGMAGDDLDDEELTESPIPTQAQWYQRAEPLFSGEPPLWDTFLTMVGEMQDLHPDAAITYKMEEAVDGSQIPAKDRLEQLLADSKNYRVTQLGELYYHLTAANSDTETIDELCSEIEQALIQQELIDEVGDVEDTIPGTNFDSLLTLSEIASSPDPITEADITDGTALSEGRQLQKARELLQDGEKSLYSQLTELSSELQEQKPEDFITTQLERALKGPDLISASRAEALIERAESILAGEEPDDDDDERSAEELWAKVIDPGDGTIVVIDPEDDDS